MEEVTKIAVIGLTPACLCMILRSQLGPISLILSLTACVGVFLISIRFFSTILDLLDRLQELSGLADGITTPVLKVTGIGILSQITASICEDSGETALGKAVELGCSIMAIYVSVPLIYSVLDLLERLLGGVS